LKPKVRGCAFAWSFGKLGLKNLELSMQKLQVQTLDQFCAKIHQVLLYTNLFV